VKICYETVRVPKPFYTFPLFALFKNDIDEDMWPFLKSDVVSGKSKPIYSRTATASLPI